MEILLYYEKGGGLAGVLNYFPNDIPAPPGWWQATLTNPERRFIERAGHFNLIVDPAQQRQGIGMNLLAEANRRWHIDFEQQDYTAAGASLVQAFYKRRA
jgi:GNAT superfamily N-acetyltransferase